MNILVLGAGRVGAAIARDLAGNRDDGFRVTAADRSSEALQALEAHGIATRSADLTDGGALEALLRDADLVVGAVPGPLGFETLRRVIDAGRDVVDISFFPEDAFDLDALALERGVRAVVDAGVAPGLGNLILGYLEATLDSTESFHCQVGGLPRDRRGAWEYRAPFSPVDVLEEYTRPVRLRRDGREVVLPALAEVEPVESREVGTLEAFLTDGLRTLLRTSRTPTLIEKTLRYPGHVARVKLVEESGFLGTQPVDVDGVPVRPIDLTVRLLAEAWRFAEGEEDLTVMRVEVVGREAGGRVRYVYDLLDRYDVASGTLSMARATGYTCTALVRWLAEGRWTRPGIAPPERLAADPACLGHVLASLAERGVRVDRHVERLPAEA
jgi:saccharopine dehydrogenase-like NADP-dependent oxidoreductase